MSLEELNAFFGVNYKSWSMFEKSILIPVKEELDGISKITFTYEANFENLGIGRPSFRSIYIDLVDRNIVQGTLI